MKLKFKLLIVLIMMAAATTAQNIRWEQIKPISAQVQKTTPNGNDLLLIEDSEASGTRKHIKISSLIAAAMQTIDTLEMNGNNLQVSLSGDGQPKKSVSLAQFLDNTDNQNIYIDSTETQYLIWIDNGDTVYFPKAAATAGSFITILKDGAAIGTRQKLDFQDSTGIAITATDDATNGRVKVNIRNTAPDQTVIINEGLGIDITGTYPNFTAKIDTADVSILTRQRAAHEYQPKGNYLTGETAQNLTYQRYPDKGIMNISSGTGDTIPVVDSVNAGLMTPENLKKLEELDSIITKNGNINIDTVGNVIICDTTEGAGVTYEIKYGLLYNWYAATDSRKISSSDDWVIPSNDDTENGFTLLMHNIISGSYYNFDNGSEITYGLRTTGSDYWDDTNGTNIYGFNSTGAGYRFNDGTFSYKNVQTNFWCYGDFDIEFGNVCFITIYNYNLWRGGDSYKNANSIRLLYIGSGTPTSYTGNDGKGYDVVAIGTSPVQYWLAENLAETKYRNGDLIPEVTDNSAWAALTTGALCAYNNDWSNAYTEISTGGITCDTLYTAAQIVEMLSNYTTPEEVAQMISDSLANYSGGIIEETDPVYVADSTAIKDTLTAHNERLLTIEATLESGGDNWGTQTVVTDNTLSGNGTVASPLKADTTKLTTTYDLITGLAGKEPANANIQSHISGDGDLSATNEIQDLSRTENTLSLTGDASTVDLSPYLDNTDSQTLSADSTSTTRGIQISGGNRVHFSINDADASTTNELQNLSKSKTGNNVTVNISNGTGTTFSVSDADSSATNEIQTLSIDSTATTYDIEISGGNRIHFNKGTTTGINYQPAQSITYNATPEFDFTAGNNGIIQLSGDIAAFTFSKVPDGAFGSIVVVQDGTGGWDISSFLTDSAQVTVMVEQTETTTPGETDITGVRDSIAMVFDSIADIQVSIAGLLDSIAVLRDSVAELRTDINTVQGTVAGLSYTTTNVTLTAAGWSSYAQSVTVTGVTASSDVFVYAPTNRTEFLEYGAAQVSATAIGTNSVTFTCTTVPETDITNVIIVWK